jgi:flavin reductase (DIM6/NTAB) family NADH-FMN oxidoreductase RutF
MEALVSDLVAHNIQNRTVAVIENGSWAPASGGLIRAELEKCSNLNILDATITLKSSVKSTQLSEIYDLAKTIAATFPGTVAPMIKPPQADSPGTVDPGAMFKLSYGLFVLTAKDADKDNGCIINTVTQITASPVKISIIVNKANFTHNMIKKAGEFNVSILSEDAPFRIFEQFGFSSGKDANKFAACAYDTRTANGIRYIPESTNGVISGKIAQTFDYGTHTLFIADVTEAFVLSAKKSVTYQYYFDNIKPKPQPPKDNKIAFVCKICGYVYDGDALPDGFICPLCKHGADDFEKTV